MFLAVKLLDTTILSLYFTLLHGHQKSFFSFFTNRSKKNSAQKITILYNFAKLNPNTSHYE